MKRKLSLLLIVFGVGLIFSQSPGGVSQSDIWSKVIKNTPANTFQYKDFGKKEKAITVGAGTSMTPSLFNYNYSYTYNAGSYVSFLSKIESLKDATIFIVSQPLPPANPTDLQALMGTEWAVPTTGVNEQAFKFSTASFEKNGTTMTYPTASGSRPNARINTLVWHNFNSRKIVNSFGVSGESSVFVGKAFTGAVNFQGEIPEFIVYRKALNEKEKLRVESYLAIKYGITLQADVNYYNSKNEIIWHKENNQNFNNRIFGLGRDSNSGLYQRQSSSAHDVGPIKKMIFWSGTSGLLADNYTNTTYIEDHSFINIGDNNASETPNVVLNSGVKKIDRVWLAEKFGPSTHNLVTNLKYKPDAGIVLLPNEALWLLIDKNAGNTALSDFNGTGVEVYPVTSLTGGYAEYNNLKWASDITTYNQFTFGVGPKMLVIATPVPMACNATTGVVDFSIRAGQPLYTVNIHGTDNTYNQQFIQPNNNFSLGLSAGSYVVTVTDATNYTQSANFTVTPTPGMQIELGPDQNLGFGSSVTLNAAAGVSIGTVTYSWYLNGSPISNTPSIVANQSGIYNCVILNTVTGCSIQDSVNINIDPTPRMSSSKVFPNPSSGSFAVNVDLDEVKDVSIAVYDVTGKTLVSEYLNGQNHYEFNYVLRTRGIYFVSITAKDYHTTHKLIIN